MGVNGRVAPALVGALRIALGLVLLIAGILKAHDGAAATAASIAGYRVLPPALNATFGVLLPYLEIVLGGYLASGFYARGAAFVAAAQFLVFAAAVASLVVRGIPADCGCFGSGVRTPPSWGHVAADLALALLALGVARFGPGRFAVDASSRGAGREPSAS